MKGYVKKLVLMLSLSMLVIACAEEEKKEDAVPTTVTFKMAANYGASLPQSSVQSRSSKVSYMINDCQSPFVDPSNDSPLLAPGLDCDGDGGVVRYTTPTESKIAIKYLYFQHENGSKVELVPDTGLLSNSHVIDLKVPVTVDTTSILSGTYVRFYAEFYYMDMKMELNNLGNYEMIRLYVSDDDFETEGNLGHHQGDVLMLNRMLEIAEYQFVQPGMEWNGELLQATRTNAIQGISTPDPQTSHVRGLFGNDDLWNQPQFMQGAHQDIFVIDEAVALTIASTGGTVTLTFDLRDTWYFEDFDGNQVFNPCTRSGENTQTPQNVAPAQIMDGCDGQATWSPILPNIIPSYSN